MSYTLDATGLLLEGEGLGRQYAVRELDTLAPLNTRMMRFAYRGYIDPYYTDWQPPGINRYGTLGLGVYKNMSAFGLRFNATRLDMKYPETVTPSTDEILNWDVATVNNFFGWVSEWSIGSSDGFPFNLNNDHNANFMRFFTNNGIEWRTFGGGLTVSGFERSYQAQHFLSGRSVIARIQNLGSTGQYHNRKNNELTAGANDTTLFGFPSLADYADVTMGWEIRANELDKGVLCRLVWDNEGHSNLLDVFDNASPFGEWTNVVAEDDDTGNTWRPALTTYAWPTHIHMSLGFPYSGIALKKYAVEYYDIDDEVIVA